MKIKLLKPRFRKYLKIHGLIKKFEKQVTLFLKNPKHPSLHTELLIPKQMRIYSFRIDREYRAIFILINPSEAEIVDINDHYQ